MTIVPCCYRNVMIRIFDTTEVSPEKKQEKIGLEKFVVKAGHSVHKSK